MASSGLGPEPSAPWQVRVCRQLWKIAAGVGGFIVLGLGGNLLAAWLTSSKGVIPPDSPLIWLVDRWFILLPIGVCLLLLALLFKMGSRWPDHAFLASPSQQNRTHMLRRLRYHYHELMVQSLQGAAWLELDLAHKPDAVQNATTLLLHQSSQPKRLFPPGTSVAQVYAEANGELLILGEPGCGKSALLHTLALHLVGQADHDQSCPLPVVFPLSTWATKRFPLEQWMEQQLTQLYDVPKRLSQQWIREEQILPLFDGLDEVEEAARLACIQAINTYHREHLHPLVVCSRSTEYIAASTQAHLECQYAVEIQPLSRSRVIAVLAQGGKSLAALRAAYKKNVALQELATTPLMLNLLILTYQGTTSRDLPVREAELQQQLFARYLERMVERKGDNSRYPLERTRARLSWLARQMREHNQTIFFLEQLQPSWLPKKRKALYLWSTGLVIGFIVALVSGLSFTLPTRQISGLIIGLAIGLLFGLLFGLPLAKNVEIQPVESLDWSWKKARSGLFMSLLYGLILTLILGSSRGITTGLVVALIVLLGIVPLNTLVGGIGHKQLSEHLHFSPNEGMHRSARNGLLIGLLSGLTTGLIAGLTFGLSWGPSAILVVMPNAVLLAALVSGLTAFIQHYILRFWLWRLQLFPWHAKAFLEAARERHILLRVGGGYQFVHRLLLNYFADLDQGLVPAPAPQPIHRQVVQSPPLTPE